MHFDKNVISKEKQSCYKVKWQAIYFDKRQVPKWVPALTLSSPKGCQNMKVSKYENVFHSDKDVLSHTFNFMLNCFNFSTILYNFNDPVSQFMWLCSINWGKKNCSQLNEILDMQTRHLLSCWWVFRPICKVNMSSNPCQFFARRFLDYAHTLSLLQAPFIYNVECNCRKTITQHSYTDDNHYIRSRN